MIKLPEDGILYHGSYTEVSQIDLSKCRYGLDFGKGFYVCCKPAPISPRQSEKQSATGSFPKT